MTFHCARCERTLETPTLAFVTWCPCGAGYRVGPATLNDGARGVGVFPVRTLEQSSTTNARCTFCGEPYNADGYPRLTLFRQPTCQAGTWHVVQTSEIACAACQANIPVNFDDSITPQWAELLEADHGEGPEA